MLCFSPSLIALGLSLQLRKLDFLDKAFEISSQRHGLAALLRNGNAPVSLHARAWKLETLFEDFQSFLVVSLLIQAQANSDSSSDVLRFADTF